MVRRTLGTIAVLLVLAAGARGQMMEDYLDIGVMKVRPEKRTEFESIIKKLVDANRRHNGDAWVALDTIFGEQYTIYLISTRTSHGAIDTGYEMFMSAMNKGLGQAASTKLLQDFNTTVSGVRGELRRRRWDLSANPPADAAAMGRRLGEARWIRTTRVHVRPGRQLQFEAQLKTIKEAAEKGNTNYPSLVSQTIAGQKGSVFYISWLVKSLADFDSIPTLQQLLGEDGFRSLQSQAADNVETAETIIARIVPELSNPPAAVAAVAPDFWNPKPPPAAKPKAKVEAANP